MIISTEICSNAVKTDLGDAFERHVATYRGSKQFALGFPETKWLNAIRIRACMASGEKLKKLTDELLKLLSNPEAVGENFKTQFMTIYEEAGRHAYPLTWSLLDELHAIVGITHDYTLQCFDLGMVRRMEDEAVSNESMRKFVDDMLRELKATRKKPEHKVYPKVFEIYSEALVFLLLRERGGAGLTLDKIPENRENPGPDFICRLTTERNGKERVLEFYIEVKTLDIVDSSLRLPEMLDEGLDTQIEIERQQRAGKKVATAFEEIEPYRRAGNDTEYDSRSIRQVIEVLTKKAAQNFKSSQFRRGPTFALANLLRTPLFGQGASTLAPFFYDDRYGAACISGVLWHIAFGQLDAPIHRWPDFEGAGTTDGELKRAGFLVDPAVAVGAAGLIVLHADKGAYRFDGLYDPRWKNEWQWSDLDTEKVMSVLCGDYNDRSNSRAHEYSRYVDRDSHT